MTEATPPQAVPVPPAMNRRWLNAVRVLSILNVAMMCPFVLGWMYPLALGWMMASPRGLILVGCCAIPVGCFAWLVYSFTKKLYAQNPKKGLALAAARGVVGLLMVLPLAAPLSYGFESWDWQTLGILAVAGLPAIGLVASAILAFRKTGGEPWNARLTGAVLLHGFVYLAVPLLGAAIFIPSLMPSRIAANQAAAVGSLRTLNTAMKTYQSEYGHGFAPSLTALGPWPPSSPGRASSSAPKSSCQAAGLIDEILASGRKRGYTFELTPGARAGNTSPDCPAGVLTYTLSARPISSETGDQSYFTDQTGVIRYTSENRPAKAEDPPLLGE